MTVFTAVVDSITVSVTYSTIACYRNSTFIVTALTLSSFLSSADLGIRSGAAVVTPLTFSAQFPATRLQADFIVDFPALIPSNNGREFVPLSYAQKVSKTQSGKTVRRLLSSAPGGGKMSLEFRELTDTETESIIAAYDLCKGRKGSIRLPSQVFSGTTGNLTAIMQLNGYNCQWKFLTPPKVTTSMRNGRSTVRVELKPFNPKRFIQV
jgi:hypothetical protein